MNIPIGQHFVDNTGKEWVVYSRETNSEDILVSICSLNEPRQYFNNRKESELINRASSEKIKLTKQVMYPNNIRLRKTSLIIEIIQFTIKNQIKQL